MDYIIFGIGSGASLVVIGWLFREWGPRIRDRRPADDEILSAEEMVTRMAWARFCGTCGMALLLCGVLILLITAVVAAIGPSDEQGARAVLIGASLAPLLMLAWAWLYLRQFGALGVIRPKAKTSLSSAPATPQTEATSVTPAADIAPGAPAPSFAEVAAGRGGMGRFSAFFRRGAAETEVGSTSSANDQVPSPTDAVIAELAGVSPVDTIDDKRLSADDPLVTAVMSVPKSAVVGGIEDDLLSDVFGVRDETSGDGTAGDQEEDTVSESTIDTSLQADNAIADESGETPTDERTALDNLRRQRIARLAQTDSSS